jgi:hypothetical protein
MPQECSKKALRFRHFLRKRVFRFLRVATEGAVVGERLERYIEAAMVDEIDNVNHDAAGAEGL